MKKNFLSKKIFFSKKNLEIIFLFFFIFFLNFFSENTFAQKKYFQQDVAYKIDATLDDIKHTLIGTEKLIYKNNSPEMLPFIYVHLYQNAYSSQQSAFAKQFLRNNNTKFYFAKESQMGSMNLSSATINGQQLEIIPEKNNPDIVKIILNKSLASSESIILDINFTEHFPDVFSRGGHIGQQYLATQWYPKPAVYDAAGWHLIPYLDQGEFYGEFGKFDVSLTLPENYVVGATGTLQTETEKTFIVNKIVETEKFIKEIEKNKTVSDSFPASSHNTKTIRFTADNIHDFAWFADKRFLVLHDEAKLQNGKTIPTFVYFRSVDTPLWQNAAKYAARAVEYYSERIGDYPYAHASAVMQQSNGVGGGMEYPMITLIGDMPTAKDLDETITHEVGHNWFYGILGSNERDNGWMDEGFNTYYEQAYSEKYYAKDTSKGFMKNFLTKNSDYTPIEIAMQKQVFLRRDQAPSTTSDSLTELNYGLDVYMKTAMSMRILEKYFGTEKFDKMMHQYFSEWQFKHPQPNDVRQVFERATGDNLSWFFDGLIGSTKQTDYAITNKKTVGDKVQLTIKNKAQLDVPFEISAIKNNKIVGRQWYKGTTDTTNVYFNKVDADAFVLDAEHIIPDINRGNNYYKAGSNFLPTIPPLRLKFFGGFDNSQRTNIYIAPALACNVYDGGMLGILLHNGTMPEKKFSWSLAPMYSFLQKQINGVADVDYSFFSGKNKITFGAGWKKFTDYDNSTIRPGFIFKSRDDYQRFSFNADIDFATTPTSAFHHKLSFRHLIIRRNIYTEGEVLLIRDTPVINISELSYKGDLKNALGNTSWNLKAEYQSYLDLNKTRQQYLRPTVEVKHNFVYQQGKSVYARVFAGAMLFQTGAQNSYLYNNARGSLGLVQRGFNDYKYDDYYFGRNEQTGFWAHQINPNTEGGMKFLLPSGASTALGFSNDFIFSVNLKTDLPVALPKFLNGLRPYFDIGYFSDNRNASIRNATNWIASGGISFEVSDVLGIYYPLFYSGGSCADDPNGLNCLMQQRTNFLDKVVFNINLKGLGEIFKNDKKLE